MTIQILILIIGLILILLGANFLIDGASSIARRSGLSEFVIGLTIVGIGTSAPEMVVSFISAINGNSDMAIGNVVGSNIFNTMFILGITSIISPLFITSTNMKRDIPMNIFVTMLLIITGLNRTILGVGENILTKIDGILFLLIFAGYLYISFKKDNKEEENESPEKSKKVFVSIILLILGFAGLIFGGKLFISSATNISKALGVSDAFIAITVMAVGTSLPELATCVVAALKGKGQLALGNVLGSNISNILLILGGASLIHPLGIESITSVDLGMILLCSIFILASAFLFKKKHIDKVEGIALIIMHLLYTFWLIYNI